jgi:hypothetical protein
MSLVTEDAGRHALVMDFSSALNGADTRRLMMQDIIECL